MTPSTNDTRFQPLSEKSDLNIAYYIIRDTAVSYIKVITSKVNSLALPLISAVMDRVNFIFTRKHSAINITELPQNCEGIIAEFLIPDERRKFTLAECRRAPEIKLINTGIKNRTKRELDRFKECEECRKFFGHILDNTNITSERKLYLIRAQIKQEASVFGLTYEGGLINEIIKYINSAERKRKIASAESTFAEDLIYELLEEGHQVDDLQTEYNSIMTDFENKLIPSEEEKAQRISNAIADWQSNNPGIVENISNISLEGKNIKVIPQYIAGFKNLKDLGLSYNNITDVSALAALVKLKKLGLENNNITDVSTLRTLIKLKDLDLSLNNITDVSALAALVKLKRLFLWSNNITDVSALAALVKLKDFGLSGNNITDVSALAALTKLERLSLLSNNITDISVLRTLVELETLDLSHNNITNVSALAVLVKLKDLGLSGNNITDVSVLDHLVKLERLDLSGNNITDVSALDHLVKLEWLYPSR